ncbi:MAG: GTPase Era [Pseudomonadales bacterium]|nr:GTPase Era [Pseudomonadales bacterium]
MSDSVGSKCGLVALIGRPNVGKSTLLNYLIGQKLSITSRKPQTTRHRILGIKTTDDVQIIYVDTPGLHSRNDKALNRYMNKTVGSVIQDVDVILFVVDRVRWTEEDELVFSNLQQASCPVLLLVNKSDLLDDKEVLLPFIDKISKRRVFSEIIPLSALKGHNVQELEKAIVHYLPQGPFMFPAEQLTDKNSRFIAAEFIREKITRQMGEELPYEVAVEIEEFREISGILHISALILVEKAGQKKIVIGQDGKRLRLIGSEARKDLERLFDIKVMLKLWVKVKGGWSDDDRALRSLGYD